MCGDDLLSPGPNVRNEKRWIPASPFRMMTYIGLFLQTCYMLYSCLLRVKTICVLERMRFCKKVKKKEGIILFPTFPVDKKKALEGFLMLFIWFVLFYCCIWPECCKQNIEQHTSQVHLAVRKC